VADILALDLHVSLADVVHAGVALVAAQGGARSRFVEAVSSSVFQRHALKVAAVLELVQSLISVDLAVLIHSSCRSEGEEAALVKPSEHGAGFFAILNGIGVHFGHGHWILALAVQEVIATAVPGGGTLSAGYTSQSSNGNKSKHFLLL